MIFKTFGLVVLVLILPSVGLPDTDASSSKIQWHAYDDGIARGKFEKKKVFLHFMADWCFYCHVMENKTFADPAVISSLNESFIPIKVDYDKEPETSTFYGVSGLPDTVFITENGEIIGRRPGYIPPDVLKMILEAILEHSSQE
jgi:uncharacterized protein YyaL (SSP411 family)